MKKALFVAGALSFAQLASAATVSYTSGPFNASYDLQFDLGGNFSADSPANVTGLQRFDTSLGTLTGVTFDITSGLFDLDLEIYGNPQPQAEFYGEFTGSIQGDLLYSNGSSSIVIEGIGDSLDISCGGFEPDECFEGYSTSLDYSSDSFEVPRQLSEFSLSDITGVGDVDNLSLSIAVFGASFIDATGLDFVEIFGVANITDAYVDVTYEFTPVPLPATAWLFGSA